MPLAPRGPGQLREGLRYVRRTPALLWPIVLVFFVGTFGYNFAIILSAYTKDIFNSGADVYGLLNTAMAAGSVAGALVAARRHHATLAVLFLSAAGVGVGLVLLGLTPWFIPFVVLLVAVGFISVTFNTLGNSSVQLASSPELRGRVMSLYMLVFMGGTPARLADGRVDHRAVGRADRPGDLRRGLRDRRGRWRPCWRPGRPGSRST